MAGELVYFWIPVPDAERAQAFYGGLFGWDAMDVPTGEDNKKRAYSEDCRVGWVTHSGAKKTRRATSRPMATSRSPTRRVSGPS